MMSIRAADRIDNDLLRFPIGIGDQVDGVLVFDLKSMARIVKKCLSRNGGRFERSGLEAFEFSIGRK